MVNKQQFNLTNKIWHRSYDIGNTRDYIEVPDVRKFIELLISNTHFESHNDMDDWVNMVKELAGERLI